MYRDISPIMQNLMEKNMEKQMVTAMYRVI